MNIIGRWREDCGTCERDDTKEEGNQTNAMQEILVKGMSYAPHKHGFFASERQVQRQRTASNRLSRLHSYTARTTQTGAC